MVITIYTINDCPFCKKEKDYLTSHNLPFIEKNLESNREYLEEMMAVSDKFAGVPFTDINKDDGTRVKLKGFTKEEFDAALGFVGEEPLYRPVPTRIETSTGQAFDLPPLTPKKPESRVVSDATTPAPEPSSSDQPVPVPTPPPIPTPSPSPEPAKEPPKSEPVPSEVPSKPVSDEALNKVLSSLESLSIKSPASQNPAVASTVAASASAPLPQIPDFK